MSGAATTPAGTFAGAPARPLDADWRAEGGVLGVPTDGSAGVHAAAAVPAAGAAVPAAGAAVPGAGAAGPGAGARHGPRGLRDASLRYRLPPDGLYDLARGRAVLAGFALVDAGDVDVDGLRPEAARERVTAAAGRLRERVRWPVFLGGDHAVSFPLLLAYDDVPELHVVQLDAHLDFSDIRGGERFGNTSAFRRAVEAMPNLAHVTTIGLRGLRTDPEAVAAARARGHTLVAAAEVEADLRGVVERLPVGRRVYLSFDVDVLDPSLLPGTGSPEVDGLRYRDVATLIAATAALNEVVGADVVELAPDLDPSGRSALAAVRATFDLWAAVRG